MVKGGTPKVLLETGRKFSPGVTGWLRSHQSLSGARSQAVYIEPGGTLEPSKTYTVRVRARSKGGAEASAAKLEETKEWSFTTEEKPGTRSVAFSLDLAKEPVRWQGAFFSGFCNVVFCTDDATFGPTYALMDEARKEHRRAWSYERNFWMTGTEYQPQPFLPPHMPNIVRERETRRITTMEKGTNSMLLRVEDVFGHEQYGVAANRPLAGDYRAGDEVLIADGVSDARAKVLAVGDPLGTVRVATFPEPTNGWKITYAGGLPEKENPDAPGLVPPGGCYLRKLNPPGTPCYYWGRLDKEWDLAHQRHGRRLMVNFADATGDLSRDGRSWTTVKDYAEWHAVAREIAGHLFDRYGAGAMEFTWSVFNEPDLGVIFWRADWNELQKFYDYTVDAILRAAEDRGYDSRRVFVGGLELGGIFGVNLKLTEFLAHCSPRATAPGAVRENAAFADARLNGLRSKRVEALCASHGGKGSPCDFISIHSYNTAEGMAAKLIRAKEAALEMDPEFYRNLWINSHESCPDWMPPPDLAAADAYLGNGYFSTWCADVVHRQLRKAKADNRYAMGETLVTVFPPNLNFGGMPAFTRILYADDGNGGEVRRVTVPEPEFHALNLLSDFGSNYWVLGEKIMGGHRVAGFAGRDGGVMRALIYSHDAQDTQSRSETQFDVTLDLAGLQGKEFEIREYRFDKDHNSYFRAGRELRDRPDNQERGLGSAPKRYRREEIEKIQALSECHPTRSARVRVGEGGRLLWNLEVAGNGLNFLVLKPVARPGSNR